MKRPSKQTLLLVAMWAGALIAVAALAMSRRAPSTTDGDGPLTVGPGATPAAEDTAASARPEPPGEATAPSMYRGGPTHPGRSTAVGPVEPEVRFAYETGGMVKAQVVFGPEGRIYVASLGSPGHGLGAEPSPGALTVLTPEGEVVWRRELEGDVYSTPLVTPSGRVYIGSDAGYFWALAPDGEVRWRLRTEGDADTGPVLVRGVLYFSAGRHLWAVREDGSVAWQFEAESKIFTSPAVFRGESAEETTIYVGSQDDRLYAFAADGTQRWAFRARADIDSSPVVGDDGTVYFGADDRRVYAVSPDGRKRYDVELGGFVRGPVALGTDGALVVPVMGPRPRVVCLDAATGEERWVFALPMTDSRELGVMSGPLIDAAGAIYFGGHDDYVYALSPAGELRWAHAVDGDVDAPPALGADGVLYVGSDDGRLYAIGAPSDD